MQIMQPTLSQPSMNENENCRKKSISGDSFSFPSTPNNDSDFEFGSLTPDSPSSDPCMTSPADHLFFNGRLQPHSFPVMFHRPIGGAASTTSRTSSIGSKDSLVSSRSNSTNSRSSCSSSARTSSSDTSERRLIHNKVSLTSSHNNKGSAYSNNRTMVSGYNQAYGSSKRWQYITSVPALSRDASKRWRNGDMKKEEGKKKRKKKKKKEKEKGSGVRLRFGRRILRWFVMVCRECHAMEPSKVKNKEIMVHKNVNNL